MGAFIVEGPSTQGSGPLVYRRAMHLSRPAVGLSGLLLLLPLLLACPGNPGQPDEEPDRPAPEEEAPELPDPEVAYEITGTRYYVDPVGGDDANDGLTREQAWRTLDKALATLEAGDAALLRSGNHGALREREPSGRTGWVTFLADEGQAPVLTSIRVDYPERADAWLRFDGLRVEPEWVDPGADPQQPGANSSTYNKSATPFSVENVAHVQLLRSRLTGTLKYLTVQAAQVVDSEDVLISGVHAQRTDRGFFVSGSRSVTLARSQLHEGVSSCIRIQPGNQDILVDSVHCHDFNWDEADDYCPRDGNNPHGSAVSIRSGGLIVRNSMFHDTPGVMLYDGDGGAVASYSDVLIENNAIFDVNNVYPLRIYGQAENVVVRNNLLVGKFRLTDTGENTPDDRYRYGVALMHHTPAPGHDASGLFVHNNVIVGGAMLQPGANEHHNLIGSLNIDGWQCEGGEGTYVANCAYSGADPHYFEEGFFVGPVDFHPGHNLIPDFRPAAGSPAINAGDASNQPERSLGGLEDGFLLSTGPLRDEAHHSVGPYQP